MISSLWLEITPPNGFTAMKNVQVFALAAMTCGSIASADVVDFIADVNSTTNSSLTGVALSGSLDYNFTSGSIGQLVISLSNTSSTSVGGYLTGLVFNINSSDSSAYASLGSTISNSFKDTGAEAANPFGNFDAGAALGANWSGGGNPKGGIGAGESGSLTFTIFANDASMLNASSFLGDGNDIALRFRGLTDGGSDKLLVTTDTNQVNVVPLPAPVYAGGAMLGLGLVVRRLRRNA